VDTGGLVGGGAAEEGEAAGGVATGAPGPATSGFWGRVKSMVIASWASFSNETMRPSS
jgi:hypothetical protein